MPHLLSWSSVWRWVLTAGHSAARMPVPGGVTAAVFDNHMVLLDAFELEAHAEGGTAGALVEGVALPLDAAVAEAEGVLELR